jgi:probable phosphoglycerate mutase
LSPRLPRTPFWFLRHGQTEYNARGLSQGAIDIPLNDTGRAQAAEAAALLADRGIGSIICSPMLRTRETAAIVNETLALPITYEPAIREVVFGGMEGKPIAPWFQSWLDGSFTPEGAESFAELSLRIEAALRDILALPGPVLVVAHGGVFRAVRDLLGISREGFTPNGVPLFCEPAGQGWRVVACEVAGVARPTGIG